jgi:integrase
MSKTVKDSGGKRKDAPATLTAAAIKKYVPLSKRRRIRDLGSQSLYLIIEPSGFKSFEMRFRRPDGRPGKIRLGKYDPTDREIDGDPVVGQQLTLHAARTLASKLHRERKLGRDVIGDHKAIRQRQRAEIEQRVATNLGSCLREFFVEHKVRKRGTRPRRWRETARLLGLDYPLGGDPGSYEPQLVKGGLAEVWRDRPVREIDHELIFTTVRDAGRHGIPGLERRNRGNSDARKRALHSALSVFFAWLKRERKITSNPCADLERPGPPADRDRVLKDHEIRWFWRAGGQVGEPFGTIFKMLLLSGARLNEAAGMKWSELSEDGATWNLPASRTKNARAHVLPLPPLLRELIGAVKRKAGVDLIFTTTGASAPSGWSRAKKRLDEAMLAIARAELGAEVTLDSWRLHDLRRSFATGMADIGIAPHIIEACLNHVSGHKGGVAGIYNRAAYAAEKKAALKRWAAHVEALVNGTTDNVVALQPRQGGGA